jgi:hypothetical protein
MANRTNFQDFSDDLTCMVLEKLSRPGLKHAYEGMMALASVACVSPRYARLVKEHAWEGACRKVAPEACMKLQLAPLTGSENSPGGEGWASFAKLLVWCPGFRVGKKHHRKVADTIELGTDGHLKSKYVESHLCRDDEASIEVPLHELIFAETSRRGASYVFRCSAHHWTLNDDFLADSRYVTVQAFDYEHDDSRMVYRGFCSPAQAGIAACGLRGIAMPLTIVSAREGSVGPRSAQVEDICPFCSSPIRLKDETFDWWRNFWMGRNRHFADFLVCSTGHVLGLARSYYNLVKVES